MGKPIDDIPLAQRRALAVKLLLNGEGISEVSRKARLSLPTVSKYKDLVEREGADALARLRIHGGPRDWMMLRKAGSLARSSTHPGFTAIRDRPGP
ncbi:helix-turn-helix domain-containing protein [Paraburkholderia nemoris]|uniref:helix-turn-helix domain-containing protein n=1 Tax=Paraburkholderia nemoris TaxID=2793076 RepID=UPI0038BAF7A0